MQYKSFLLFVQLVIFCNQSYFINVEALVGQNVRNARENEFPAMVCIAKIVSEPFEADDVVRCGGILISQNHVLTAEHCLYMVQISQYRAIVGSVNIMNGIRRTPLWWMSYDQWALANEVNREFERNDIGMLKLIEIENFHVIPASLYNGLNNQLVGLCVNLAGWGLTSSGQCPAILKTASVYIISIDHCERIVYNLDPRDDLFIHERYFCSITQPYVLVDAGDSGGPVLFQNTVLGVNSGTTPHLNGNFHGGKVNCHTGVQFYRNFINDSLNM